MAISLGSNISSLAAQRELGQSTASLEQSYTRLSSGLRINQASDDAAGLAIVSQLNSKSRVFMQAVRNVNDALSASSIAEGALNSLKAISQRQLELAEEAANGTYSTKQRGALNKEANALVDEYNRIVSTTTFNGMSLLNPSLGTVIIQAGYGQTNGTLQLGLSNQLARFAGNGTFQDAQNVGLNDSPVADVVGDVNGDGKADVITANYNQNTVTVLLGNGDGTFQPSQDFDGTGGPNSIDLVDVNGDGKLDLVTINRAANQTIGVLLGNGNGTFKAAQSFALGFYALDSIAGDYNGDGKADIVVGNNSGGLDILVGNGNGTFKAAQTISPSGSSVSVSSDDFNGDGITDLVSASSANYLTVLLGNGNGTFSASQSIAAGFGGTTVTVGDFNGDGITDIASADSGTNTVSISLGNGNGTFKARQSIAINDSPNSISIGDFNGDGLTDLVTSSYDNGDVELLIGNGDGTFKAAQSKIISTVSGSPGPKAVAVTDFNGDGVSDLATADYGSIDVGILLGNGNYTSTAPYLNLNSQQNARNALNTVTANLNRIEAQLGAIGATTSRFTTAIATLQTESENFQAAAGRIQDTDVAQETANLTRTQILQQAAASVLAQANQQPGLALKLLGG